MYTRACLLVHKLFRAAIMTWLVPADDLGLILDKTVKLEWHRANNTRIRCLRITQKVTLLHITYRCYTGPGMLAPIAHACTVSATLQTTCTFALLKQSGRARLTACSLYDSRLIMSCWSYSISHSLSCTCESKGSLLLTASCTLTLSDTESQANGLDAE